MNGAGKKAASRQLWLVPREGRTEHGCVAEVAVEVRTDRLHTYAIPESLAEHVQPGVFVRVPYGRGGRLVSGVCVRTGRQEWDHTHKPLAEVVSPEPLLSEGLLELGLWVSDYYACPPGLTLAAMVPSAVRQQRRKRVVYLRSSGREPSREPTPKQQALLSALGGGERRRDEALAAVGVGPAVLGALLKLGLVEKVNREEPVEPRLDWEPDGSAAGAAYAPCPEDEYTLTSGQQAALDAIDAAVGERGTFQTLVLFGVPGSGKTEVYVRAIRRVIAAGRQAVLLVPEIALATQIVQRLTRRFERVAVYHGRLSARVRRDTWRAIASGTVDVIIGTRSAVFAACRRLGLIVVDEEQDGSYKNLAAPYYHARDVAIKRAQIERIPVVLGSATPSLETWHNAQTLPHFRLLRLPKRVPGACLPEARLVDTAHRELGQTTRVLSPELSRRLMETVAAGEQAIVLHNRRGYAVHLRCSACGMVVSCTRCGARMVYHQVGGRIRCHRCGLSEASPPRCRDSTCQGRLERVGFAIQRLEEELGGVVPQARLLRLDRDTMRRREDYAAALRRFEAGEADILLGTQMVAKGLDFPRVRLVGVIDADFALSLPDFRAAEHVFQLVMQVVGRAGRQAGASLALVQSADVAAPAIRWAVRMDYESFAREELAARQRFMYPPLARMVRLILADARPGRARDEAERLSQGLRGLATRVHSGLRVHDAGPCVVARLRKMLRYELIVRGPRDASLQRLLHEAVAEKLLSPRVQRFRIDVDPIDLL